MIAFKDLKNTFIVYHSTFSPYFSLRFKKKIKRIQNLLYRIAENTAIEHVENTRTYSNPAKVYKRQKAGEANHFVYIYQTL